MKIIFIITSLCFTFISGEFFGQSTINEIDVKKVSKNKLYKILKSNKYDLNREWTFRDSVDTYSTKQYLSMNNDHTLFKSNNRNCFRTVWRYVDLKRNYINVNDGIFLCQEPPKGGTITIKRLFVVKEKDILRINICESKINISESLLSDKNTKSSNHIPTT